MPSKLLRMLPSVQDLLELPPLKGLRNRLTHSVVASRVRSFLEDLRTDVQSGVGDFRLPTPVELAELIARKIAHSGEPRLRPVVNATGHLLHSQLGSVPLAEDALLEIAAVTRDYASVEFDLNAGGKSPRVLAVEGLLQELTTAEAAFVANSHSSAMMLALAALAGDGEVIASRGEMLDFGDGYRLPDVISASGARLREVGATNRTRLDDYREAVCERSVVLLRVHTGGDVAAVSDESTRLDDLIQLGRERRILVVHDLASGALMNLGEMGLPDEPVAKESVRAGVDLALFRGDKLLGGPECGIIVGQKAHVQKIASHPWAHALRADKLTLAALAATLRLYRAPSTALRDIPLLSLFSAPIDNLRQRAQRLAPQLAVCPAIAEAEAREGTIRLEFACYTSQQLPTWVIALKAAQDTVERLARGLRTGVPPVVGRVQQDRLLLDLRSVFPRQDQMLIEAVAALTPASDAISSTTTSP